MRGEMRGEGRGKGGGKERKRKERKGREHYLGRQLPAETHV